MDTSKLKKFAQYARRSLIEQVQSKLKLVLAEDSAARREHPQAIKELEAKQKEFGDDQQLIEQVAYTWFNRFCALRFMDANQYNRIMVVSPIAGQFQPEILAEAKAGHLDDSVFDAKTSDKIRGLLSGTIPSRDGQAEAYRLIIVAMCNAYHRLMPYLFERIEDYTELLMPEDLLSGNSVLAYTREAMTPENCESVESIGWLYQFYISEKKDQVFEGLKKNKKITPENIPAATQLFTPHWIVKYLVENSLGRLWMLNNPSSKVIEQMKYYIKPVEEEEDFLKISSPEELKICDPAAGSGHMLTYAYDLLYAIYLDANYDPVDIPELILTKNLYGIEIDERAAELAAFALSMKAMKGNPFDDSNNRRRFFRNPIKPNICRLEKIKIDDDALEEYIEFAGKELFTADVRKTLKEFEDADNFGSLIQPTLKEPTKLLEKLASKNAQVDLFLKDTHESVLKILEQARYLAPTYSVITANPPYLGNRGMNKELTKWIASKYNDTKADLFACFIDRSLKLVETNGLISMITMQSWMFLSVYDSFRKDLIENKTLLSMNHLGSRAFDSIGGEVVSTTAFIIKNGKYAGFKGVYFDLTKQKSELKKSEWFKVVNASDDHNDKYVIATSNFESVPNNPICYWVTDELLKIFDNENIYDFSIPESSQNLTGNNDKFLRLSWEVSRDKIGINSKWLSYAKGGGYRRWYGNLDTLINWSSDAIEHYRTSKVPRIIPEYLWYKKGVTWGFISTTVPSFRYLPEAATFDVGGSSIFFKDDEHLNYFIALFNTQMVLDIVGLFNPTMNYQLKDIRNIPVIFGDEEQIKLINEMSASCQQIAKTDWNTRETSLGFTGNQLLDQNCKVLADAVLRVVQKSDVDTESLRDYEQRINEMFCNIYNIRKIPRINRDSISLFCNYEYRYQGKPNPKGLYQKDLVEEFLSYFVGCVFGRFSIDKSGVVIDDRSKDFSHFLSEIPSPSYLLDEDNVIPIIDFEGDWFEDDITERFKEFLKVTFGEDHFAENLTFIEEAIGKDIKKYFVKDFYADHVKRYKKRPIYWMFSSPKGSFNALIYMHRYQPDTVSIVLNDYLREFRTKLEARKESYEQVEISASASQKDKTNAIKAISKINKVLEEINDYEHDVLYPLAGEKIEIDLDDGVKHNYPLFGKALKKITGLS